MGTEGLGDGRGWMESRALIDAKMGVDGWDDGLGRVERWGYFVERFVTIDESWIHRYHPETKQHSKQWKHLSRQCMLHQLASMASVPNSIFTMAAIYDCCFELTEHVWQELCK